MAKMQKRADSKFYEKKITVGYDANGKSIRKSIYATSQRELDQKVFEIKTELKKGIKESTMPFKIYADSWFKTFKSNTGINTKVMYSNALNKHIIPEIGDIPLSKIAKSDIQNIYNSRTEHYETCNKIKLTLNQIFESAIEDSLISRNPAVNATLPNKPKSTKRALTNIEKKAIQLAELTPMQKAYIYVIFYCGLRREEALALNKKDFDFKELVIRIERAIVFDVNNPIISSVKTTCSERAVPIPEEAVSFLKKYTSSSKNLFLFTKQNGDPMTKSSYSKFWNRIIVNLNLAVMAPETLELMAELPPAMQKSFYPITSLTGHIFRHNYATMLYYSGISIKKAAQLMGHSTTKMITEVYAHIDEEKENAKEKLDLNIRMVL